MLKKKHNPKLFVFAGANGSGKSSTRESFSSGSMGFGIIIDIDAMAGTLNPDNPESANSYAGRQAIKVANDCIENGITFCIETTLGGRGGAINHIRDAKEAGFEIQMFYLGLNRVEANIERVAIRVENGGHNIPEETIRKRYVKSIEHLIEILSLIDELVVIDNSLINDSRIIMTAKSGEIAWQDDDLPEWAQRIGEQLK